MFWGQFKGKSNVSLASLSLQFLSFLSFLSCYLKKAAESMTEKEGLWTLEDFRGSGVTDPRRNP